MSPHPITLSIGRRTGSRGVVETYSCGDLSESHHTDGLRRLLRRMIAHGLTGPAEVRGENGMLRMVVSDIEAAAKRTLSEGETGLRLGKWTEASNPWAADRAASLCGGAQDGVSTSPWGAEAAGGGNGSGGALVGEDVSHG